MIQYAIRSRNLLNWAAFLLLRFTVVIHDKIMVNLANKMLILLHLVYEALPISDLLVGVLATLFIHLGLQLPDQLSTFLAVSLDPDLFLTSHLLQLAYLSLTASVPAFPTAYQCRLFGDLAQVSLCLAREAAYTFDLFLFPCLQGHLLVSGRLFRLYSLLAPTTT